MSTKNKLIVPHNYPVCEYHNCPMAASCLHQIAFTTMIEQEEFLHLINPNKCTKNNECTYYRRSATEKYARGFTNFQKYMYPQQYDKFMTSLVLP